MEHTKEYLDSLDAVCAQTFSYMMAATLHEKQICLVNYSLRNPDHLFFIELIFATSGITYKPIAVRGLWRRLMWRWRFKKRRKAIKWDGESKQLDVTQALNDLYPVLVQFLGKGGSYAEIYHTYYEGVNND